MSNYQNYLDNLVKQPLEIKLKSLVSEIRKLWDDNRETMAGFKGVKQEIEGRLNDPGASAEDLYAFASKLRERLPVINQVKKNLDDLNRYEIISDSLKQTIENLGDYCMNNLSLDEILKAADGTENLKEQAETQKTAFEQLQTAYMVHEKVVVFFQGVDQQFKNLMKYQNINAETVNAFTGLFNQSAESLAGLKFQIGRMHSNVLNDSAELKQLVQYCREEMTLQEAGHCHGELERIQRVQQAMEAERKRRAAQEKQEAERKQKEKEIRRKRRGRLIDNNDGTVSDPKTGLMWSAQDNDNACGMICDDPKVYCESFRGGGHKDWQNSTWHSGTSSAWKPPRPYPLWTAATASKARCRFVTW